MFQKTRIGIEALSFESFATGVLFLAVLVTACLMPAQNDSWWHLRTGQTILEAGEIALSDRFSHTVDGRYWPNHEWLAQVIFYSLYRVGGLPLLTGVAALIITAAWWIVWQLTPGPLLLRIGLTAAGATLSARQWALRPQLFSLLCVAVVLWLLVHRRYGWLPLVFVLWANLHGGVVLGIAMIVAAAIGSMLFERPLRIPLILVAIVCVVMTGATPLGSSLWTAVPGALDRSRRYGISEWRAPTLGDPTLWPFWILAAMLCVLVARHRIWRRGQPELPVAVWASLALLPVAMTASRNVAPLSIALVPALGTLLHRSASPQARARTERPILHAAVLALCGVIGTGVVARAWSAPAERLQWQPLPSQAIAALESCPDRLYNRYDEGGYLIWFVPERKVFIDSRQDPYPPEFVQEHLRAEQSGHYEALFDEHSIRCAFLPAGSLMARRLAAAKWQPLYEDRSWVVLSDRGQR